jgi:hypothetical protein
LFGAIAVLTPAPSHNIGRIQSAAPPYMMAPAGLDPIEEAAMAVLRRQANMALAQLRMPAAER